MPVVSVPENPNGLPIAKICCPTFTLEESPSFTQGKLFFGVILSKAKSFSSPFVNKTVALYSSPFEVSTTIFLAPSITCELVKIIPDSSITQPVPDDIPFDTSASI